MMNSENEHKRIVRSYRRDVRTGSGAYVYHHEVHALFEELIDKPWGVVRWHPAADVCETDDAFLIEVDLPGVADDDVRVLAEGTTLVVEGERKLGRTDEGRCVHVGERPAGKFARTFHFDHPIDTERIRHRTRDGVLAVTVPKSANKREP